MNVILDYLVRLENYFKNYTKPIEFKVYLVIFTKILNIYYGQKFFKIINL